MDGTKLDGVFADKPAEGQPAEKPADQTQANPSQTQAEEVGGDQSKPVTEAQLHQLREDMKVEVQALVDKHAIRIEDKVMAKIDKLDISPEQKEVLKQQVSGTIPKPADNQSQSQPLSQPVSPGTQQPATEQAVDRGEEIRRNAVNIMDAAGVQITKADPEFKMIDLTNPDEGLFYEQLKAAVKAKQERLSVSPEARMPAGGLGNPPNEPAHTGKSGLETLEMAYKNQ